MAGGFGAAPLKGDRFPQSIHACVVGKCPRRPPAERLPLGGRVPQKVERADALP